MMWQQLELEKVVVGWEAIEAAVWWEGELDGVVCAYAGCCVLGALCVMVDVWMLDLVFFIILFL